MPAIKNTTFQFGSLSHTQQKNAGNRVSFQARQALATKELQRAQELLKTLMDAGSLNQTRALNLFDTQATQLQPDTATLSANGLAASLNQTAEANQTTSQDFTITGNDISEPLTYTAPENSQQIQTGNVVTNLDGGTTVVPAPPTAQVGAGDVTTPTTGAEPVVTDNSAETNPAQATGTPPPVLAQTFNQIISILDEMGSLTANSASLKFDDAAGIEMNVTDEMRTTNQERFEALRTELTELMKSEEGQLAGFSEGLADLENVDISSREGGQEAINTVFSFMTDVKTENNRLFGPPPPEPTTQAQPEPQPATEPTEEIVYRGNESFVWID